MKIVKGKRRLWTREEFEWWLGRNHAAIYLYPYDIAPCGCGDINCHGWRLIPAKSVLV